jgi:hypothetical protein
MIDTAVVIATHGGTDLLRESLPKMKDRAVVVVDTGAHIDSVERLCNQYPNVAYLSTPYRGYDTGAYLWAYWMVSARNYLFMQDSCSPREPDFIEQFARAMPASEFGAVGWSSFTMTCWDSDAQREATAWMYGGKDWPLQGIFGPIFYTNRRTLLNMEQKSLLPMPPVHKLQQQAMERAWAILFHASGARVNFLRKDELPNGTEMSEGKYPALTKVFRMRA